MNKETAIRKINSAGRVGSILAKILLIIAIVAAVGTLIGGISMLVVPKDLFRFMSVGNADLEIQIDVSSDEALGSANETALAAAYSEAQKALNNLDFSIDGSSYQTRAISISEDQKQIRAEMDGSLTEVTPRRVAYLLLAATVYLIFLTALFVIVHRLCKSFRDCASPFEDGIIRNLQHFAWALIPWALIDSFVKGVFESAFSAKTSVVVGIDLTTVLAILLVFALAYIFKYGAVLQTESDETL